MSTDEDVDMAAAYLAPIIWGGAEWHQCTSSMKDAVRGHVRSLRGAGHTRPVDWTAVEAALLAPECVEAAHATVATNVNTAQVRDVIAAACAKARETGR